MTILITDSGLGGLDVAAELLRQLPGRKFKLEYFNARLPGNGYNALPDRAARTAAFETALAGMMKLNPDCIVLACNTMSVIYPDTGFAAAPPVPVFSIVPAAATALSAAASAAPAAKVILFGTETTIGSGVYRRWLLQHAVSARRIMEQPCPELGPAIERIPGAPDADKLVDNFAEELLRRYGDDGSPLLAGFCCTHYGYLRQNFLRALSGKFRGEIGVVDPAAEFASSIAVAVRGRIPSGQPEVTVRTRAVIAPIQQETIAELLKPKSPLCADALRQCRPDPRLF